MRFKFNENSPFRTVELVAPASPNKLRVLWARHPVLTFLALALLFVVAGVVYDSDLGRSSTSISSTCDSDASPLSRASARVPWLRTEPPLPLWLKFYHFRVGRAMKVVIKPIAATSDDGHHDHGSHRPRRYRPLMVDHLRAGRR